MFRFFILITALMMPVTAYAKPYTGPQALQWAEGDWALDPMLATKEQLKTFNCKTNPMTITVNATDLTYSSFSAGTDAAKAKILFAFNTYFKIQYEGEKRLMDNGKPHVWIMVFVDKDHFTWVREDWFLDGKIKDATAMRVRCQKLEVS